jgi:cell division inhibitor SepF
MWKRTMEYLGLGPDDAYEDDIEFEDEIEPRARRAESAPGRPTAVREMPVEQGDRSASQRPVFPNRDFDAAGPRRGGDDSGVVLRPGRVTRPAAEPQTIRPRRFDQAQEVADAFKAGQPVIMNLEGCERDVSRRLIDFASGICYALDGSMEKVANGVYLLKPTAGQHLGDD